MNVQQLFDTYFENIRIISTLFFSNGKFTLKLYGDTFNSSSPQLSCESVEEITCNFPSCHALFVHRYSFVTEDESLPSVVEEDCVLKFVCKNVGSLFNCDTVVCLSPTSDTCALLEAHTLGLSLKVLVTDGIDPGQSFFVIDSWNGSFPARLLFCYCPVIKLCESETSTVMYDWRAVQTTLAIASESWPTAALSWATWSHPWISYDVADIVASSTVYLVPKSISQCCVTAMSHKSVLWKYEFIVAEDVLMKHLSVEIKIAYQILLQFVALHRLACCCISNELLIKYALFWSLDKMSVATDWNDKSVVAYYMCTLKTLHLFLHKRYFPHYFMTEVNMLCNCDSAVCDISWMEEAVNNSTAVQLKAEAIQRTLTCTSSNITCSIAYHLKTLFSYSVSMSYIQLFQYLHGGSSTDHLIERHHDMLNHIHSSSLTLCYRFLKPLHAWINSSLGTLYLVKAYAASSGHHWKECMEKAEHWMLKANAGNNMPSCTVYLIHFLLLTKCYKEAVSLIDMLLASVDFTAFNANIITDNFTSGALAFSDLLLEMWNHASCHVNVMFTPLELSILFPRLKSSLLYACCSEIGYSDSPVVVLKLEFWIQYTGALCYMQSDVRPTRALKLLADAEKCMRNTVLPTVGVSDRADIAYFNILAGTSDSY